MKTNLRVCCGQINSAVGDLEGNSGKIIESIKKAQSFKSDIIAFPELAVTGYPPEDLLLKPGFVNDNIKQLKKIVKSVGNIIAIVGFVNKKGSDVYNAAAVIHQGKIQGIYHKILLPNYGVFDEKRYFTSGYRHFHLRGGSDGLGVFKMNRVVFGINICEDIWSENGPIKTQSELGANLIVNINASPYHTGKLKEREKNICSQAKKYRTQIAYINLIGGQDELVFDGQSMFVNEKGKVVKRAKAFKEDLLIVDTKLDLQHNSADQSIITICHKRSQKYPLSPLYKRTIKPLGPTAEVYQALILGLKDYVNKNGFKRAVIGLSGGIDSALVAVLAVDALGRDNVIGVFMPSPYSSNESKKDAEKLAKNLGIKLKDISIKDIFHQFLETINPHFDSQKPNIAEENLQARIRGNILMALSNKFGCIVLTTGNKSEMSTGYTTLYGDMAGGFAVIKDVPKTLVYKLSRYRNAIKNVIPKNILVKEPTAELKPNQKDSDSLPVYNILDPILKAYIEEHKGIRDIVAMGFDGQIVRDVAKLVDRNEYKRRQAPPGIKITPRAFGKDRRMPITNRYSG